MNKIFAAALLAVSALSLGACGQVDDREVGLFVRYGEVNETVAGAGMQWYNPITTDLEVMNVATQRANGTASAYTRDLQTAETRYALLFSLDRGRAVQVRRTLGPNYVETLIPPVIESVIKNEFAQYNAMNAVAQRGQIQTNILNAVRQRLAQRGIRVEGFELTNIDYSDAFEQSVERAQIAQQRAVESQNATVRVREEATQRVVQANAEAEAMRVQASALTANPALTQYEAVRKWNGVLPQYMMGGSTPFINVTPGR